MKEVNKPVNKNNESKASNENSFDASKMAVGIVGVIFCGMQVFPSVVSTDVISIASTALTTIGTGVLGALTGAFSVSTILNIKKSNSNKDNGGI